MKRNDISLFAAACLAATLLSSPAAEADQSALERMTPGRIAEIMDEKRYIARMETDSNGDPMIDAYGEEGAFRVVFGGCEKKGALPDRFCSRIKFVAAYKIDAESALAKLNKWNASIEVFGHAYLDGNGKANLKMPVNLAYGVSENFIITNLFRWNAAVPKFQNHIGYKPRF